MALIGGYRDKDNRGNDFSNLMDDISNPFSSKQTPTSAGAIPGFDEINQGFAGARGLPGVRAGLGTERMRQQQQAALNLAMQRARGQNLVSEIQARQGAQAAVQGAQALAAGARPGNAAAAARNSAVQGGNAMSALAGQRALAGAQEAAGALGMAGTLAGQARQQDIAGAQFDANLEMQRRRQVLESLRAQGSLGLGQAGLNANIAMNNANQPTGFDRLMQAGGTLASMGLFGPAGAAGAAAAPAGPQPSQQFMTSLPGTQPYGQPNYGANMMQPQLNGQASAAQPYGTQTFGNNLMGPTF